MPQSTIRPLGERKRANWVRLRTMILLRWVAIIGQLVAVYVAPNLFGLKLELGWCYFAIGVSVIGNLVATFLFPENKRLSERQNLAMILFDFLQLSFLLFLTGGLSNPFSLLLLGPVTISATALSLRSTLLLCAVAIVTVTGLAFYNIPLQTMSGEILELPQLFIFGQWIALIIAVIFTTAYSRRVTTEIHSMSDALSATQMALAREQKLTDLGGVIAAAAHELGTPLATIKLASGELVQELASQPDLREDAELIAQQTDRCRDILRDMGRAGKDDLHMRQAPLVTIVESAAEPHIDRGKEVLVNLTGTDGPTSSQPSILRMPEIIHGLRNLIQNAVDFAKTTVWVEIRWTEKVITVRILDDGRGFPHQLLGRLGDPFMGNRKRRKKNKSRPEYEGMGLGLFIAKTLLERSGATLRFANGVDETGHLGKHVGAVVEVQWPRGLIDAHLGENSIPVGQNARFDTF
ncbi:sensor histidine kinase RegB [Sulfitobacter donghicola]|uniref:histidine kinase n=1 Tax=Sulfitobacter donghicola DSW-25 = KCTC 12864 = JCM 14565 TaxID=1300350 RepID=A0A073IM25_9RHOB|nr:ActS/PrrB/RegB family redox-sensitive histidine kinase [Sulfitobacter donghicola]KEJ90625.1 sensor histidine kinase [Sulfitobacter donghicola DSW-25 = KCTC 12864 = JCM 14565]KIN67874.1 Sensor histidine kinase RegB [Sulfitobacter donghicola DSW-25 = KCTC 12864 = JCM 14565]